MPLFDDDIDPAMRYEGLAREVFKCGKWGDPWGYAAQDRYAQFIPEPPKTLGKRALSTIIIKIILDYPDTPYLSELKELEDAVWNSNTQEEIIDIIDEAIEIYNKIAQ